jgi:hypothetical protein
MLACCHSANTLSRYLQNRRGELAAALGITKELSPQLDYVREIESVPGDPAVIQALEVPVQPGPALDHCAVR